MSKFNDEIAAVINRYSMENQSNTPDFILAGYLEACLAAFDVAVQQRETWYGRDARPTPPFDADNLKYVPMEEEVSG